MLIIYTIFLAIFYSLLFAYIDIYYIKNYRNLTKKDKRLTYTLRIIFCSITSFKLITENPFITPLLIFSIWLTFDSLMGLYLKNNPFYLGKNSVLDEKGDKLDSKLDQNAKLWWFIRLGLIIGYIIVYFIIYTSF